ncbi:MAG: ribosome small subunit-dependent GTPase A, partial [Bacteroidetes bacterium]|nr:ribosome small subunit-dependent GTPase A [Bacteroidota bacterium]
MVIKTSGLLHIVRNENGEFVSCTVRGKFRIKGIRLTNPVAVGDIVEFILEEDDKGVITKIDPRRN